MGNTTSITSTSPVSLPLQPNNQLEEGLNGLAAVNAMFGQFLTDLKHHNLHRAFHKAQEIKKSLKALPPESGGLEETIEALITLINTINNGSLPVWANVASSLAQTNTGYANAETQQLNTDETVIQTTPVQINGEQNPAYQKAVDQYTTDQLTYQGFMMPAQQLASNASDTVTDLSKTFQQDYQNISAFLQLFADGAHILEGG